MSGRAALPCLRESLDLVAQEASDLVNLGDQIQGVISRLVSAALPSDPSLLIDAQAADLLSQRLSGLANFVGALAEAAPAGLAADIEAAIRTLTLAEQARRLSGPTMSPAPETGEMMTFWD
ncbi:hypothetical protein [Phenylobacterium sp.]|uniref:hypothetical protein n=1 Tax=Phenylobacterium sp. TaxID=1871053 RepID=UPI0012149787|nr:hypothetical protein [Phenylobacterium sp.]TAL31462.1 MAG: hypothetical protein EPN98_15975 [Phenylobacterium sp.]